jgi:adenylate cyclase
MSRLVVRTVLFADLRGSTALFESLGNEEATGVVTGCIDALAEPVARSGGAVVKTLGDGLMAVFDAPLQAYGAALQMHDALEGVVARGRELGASSGLAALRLQIAMAHGELVETGGDCFGDAVNVAARLLDHASDNETLLTVEALRELPAEARARFRRLDRLVLRGRVEPVEVHVLGVRRSASDTGIATEFSIVDPPDIEPDGLRLSWGRVTRSFGTGQLPVVLGRSPQSTFRVDDSRVSRSHARVDWHAGSFQLTDLSYNGTYVQFNDGEIVSLRRGSCTLHGSGSIGLGGSPVDPLAAVVGFEVLRLPEPPSA